MSIKSTYANFKARGERLYLNVLPQPPIQRVREPVRPTCGRVVGYLASNKNNRMIAWESQLEKKACLLFEFSKVVKTYKEQPIQIHYPFGNELRQYTPDFELRLVTGEKLYVEVKPSKVLSDSRLLSSLQAIDDYFSTKGYHFIVLTEEELNQPQRQKTLSFLKPYLAIKCPRTLQIEVTSWLKNRAHANLKQLVHYIGSKNIAYSLIATGLVCIDLDDPLTTTSPVFLPKDNNDETCLFAYRTGPDFKSNTIQSFENHRGRELFIGKKN